MEEKNKEINVFSFFSGAMGLDLGFEKEGFKTQMACEIEKNCCNTIKYNKPDLPLINDIRNYNSEDILSFSNYDKKKTNIIIGGPPCQAFSTIGKRQGLSDERGNVFIHFLKMAMGIEPDFLVIENVRGILSSPINNEIPNLTHKEKKLIINPSESGSALAFILRLLENNEYKYTFNLYNACYFGVPQSRERFILIATKKYKKPPFLIPTHSNSDDSLPNFVTFGEATKNIKNHNSLKFSKKKLDYFKQIPEGGNWRSLSLDKQKKALGKSFYLSGGRTGYLRRLSYDKPSPTLLTSPTMNATSLAHPTEHRPLSIEEYKAIQQFPESWEVQGNLLNQYKQVGNAVPVGLSQSIAKLIIKMLNKESIDQDYNNFSFSRYKNTSDISWKRKNYYN